MSRLIYVVMKLFNKMVTRIDFDKMDLIIKKIGNLDKLSTIEIIYTTIEIVTISIRKNLSPLQRINVAYMTGQIIFIVATITN
jgi:hypothetical protein